MLLPNFGSMEEGHLRKFDAMPREYHGPEHYLNGIKAFHAYAEMALCAHMIEMSLP